jgi:hypothetical protein
MLLFGEVLAPLAPFDKFLSIALELWASRKLVGRPC